MGTRTSSKPLTSPSAPVGCDWGIEGVDVAAYLRRIGHRRVKPSVEALASLHRAHIAAVPFENVDVVLRRHRGIDLGTIQDKIIGQRRGGYCYEHALLFAAVAERLGFRVRRRIARTMPHRAGLKTHMMQIVTAEGTDFLVDVGFGAGVWQPMPLVDGVEVDQAGWMMRLTREDDLWLLSKRVGEEWTLLHQFDDVPTRPVDYEVAHHYCSTHPRSPFVNQIVVMRLAEGVSRRLVGHEYTVEHADGRVETTPVDESNLGDLLRSLDVDPHPADVKRLVRYFG